MQGTHPCPISFEILEKRTLFAQINVADFGAFPDDGRDDRAAIQAAVNASQNGDQINFSQGVYNVAGALKFKGSRFYAGTRGTQMDFSNTSFGIHLGAGAQDITITRFIFTGAGIDMGSGSPNTLYRNIDILGNAFRNIPTNAIKATIASEDLTIDGNEFINVRGYGAFEVYNTSRFSFKYNHVIDSSHGGHLLGPREDNVLAYNYITGLTDWGFEIQRSGQSVSTNLLVEGNVIHGFKRAYGNSGGLSVIAERGINTIVRNNYIRADHEGVPLEEGHLHVGIEAGFDSGFVEGNIIGGDINSGNLTHYISASGPDMLFKGTQFFGRPQWGSETVTWAGDMPGGHGWFREESNSREADFSKMPDPWVPRDPAREGDGEIVRPPESEQPADPPIEAATDGTLWLSDLEWDSAKNGWGPVEIDRSNGERKAGDGKTLTIDAKQYRKGLGVAIDSEIVYELAGEYEKFFSTIGVDDYAGDEGSVTFEVWADGKRVFRSGTMTHASKAKSIEIDVSDVTTLKLVTTNAGDGGRNDHADWASARLLKADA
jgi:hypothetical protein